MTRISKSERVFNTLADNRVAGVTAGQLKTRGVGNPRAEITRLRAAGVPILSEQRTNSKGETRTFYSLSFSAINGAVDTE